ncbi:hypothetical protein V8C26DRAFT_156303 [Trichoderma gracile]
MNSIVFCLIVSPSVISKHQNLYMFVPLSLYSPSLCLLPFALRMGYYYQATLSKSIKAHKTSQGQYTSNKKLDLCTIGLFSSKVTAPNRMSSTRQQ